MTHVSVVIPAYRSNRTIRRAVDSVLAQTTPIHEVIVVDDGSPDDIAGPLDGLDSRVRVIRQANAGAGAARNTGINAASGQWVAFLDSDDEWFPDKLATQFDALRRHPDVGLTASRFELRPAGQLVGTRSGWSDSPVGVPLHLQGAAALRFASACWTGTVLVRRDVLAGERFRTDLRTAEDRELWYRLTRKTAVLAVDDILAVQHVTQGSLSTSDIDDDCANMMRVVELHALDLTPDERLAWQVSLHRRRAAVHLAEGRPHLARAAAWDRLRLDRSSPEAWYIWVRAALAGLL